MDTVHGGAARVGMASWGGILSQLVRQPEGGAMWVEYVEGTSAVGQREGTASLSVTFGSELACGTEVFVLVGGRRHESIQLNSVHGLGEAWLARGPDNRTLLASGVTTLEPVQHIQKLGKSARTGSQRRTEDSEVCWQLPGLNIWGGRANSFSTASGSGNMAGRDANHNRRVFAFRFNSEADADRCFFLLAPWIITGAGGGADRGERNNNNSSISLREILGLPISTAGQQVEEQKKQEERARLTLDQQHEEEKRGKEETEEDQDHDNYNNEDPFVLVKRETNKSSEPYDAIEEQPHTEMIEEVHPFSTEQCPIPPIVTGPANEASMVQPLFGATSPKPKQDVLIAAPKGQESEGNIGNESVFGNLPKDEQLAVREQTQAPHDVMDDYNLWSSGLPPSITQQEISSHIRVLIRRCVLSSGDLQDGQSAGWHDIDHTANTSAVRFASTPIGPRLRFEEYVNMVDSVLHKMELEGEFFYNDWDSDGRTDNDEPDEVREAEKHL